MFIVLELGGMNLGECFRPRIDAIHLHRPREKEELLIKLIKGAAEALRQFHQRKKIFNTVDSYYSNTKIEHQSAEYWGSPKIKIFDSERFPN